MTKPRLDTWVNGFEETLRDFIQSEDMQPGATSFLGRNREKGLFTVVADFSVKN